MVSRRARVSLLALVALQACQCDDLTLDRTPLPEIEVRDEQNNLAGGNPPLILEFGDVEIGQRAAKRVTIFNTGRAPLALTRVGPLVDATDPICPVSSAEFAYPPVSAAQGVEVREGDNRIMEVAYRPTDGGPDCAIMEIKSSDEDEPVTRVYLRARGSAARFCASESLLDFGDVLINTDKTLSTTVSNCGIRPLTLASITTTGPFPPFSVVTTVTTPRTLMPGESLPMEFRFAPTLPLRYGGTGATEPAGVVLFNTNEAGIGSLTLIGRGTTPPMCSLVVAPTAMNFGTVALGASGTRDVLMSNNGDAPCTVDSITRVMGSTEFTVSAGAAPPAVTVNPGSIATFTIQFSPTMMGLQNAVFRVHNATSNTDTDITVEANQPPPQGCALEADPSFLNFGVVPVGRINSRNITLRSIGTEDCSLSQITFPSGAPAFATTSTPTPILGTLVTAGNSINVAITFRSQTAGPHNGRVRLTYREVGFGNPTRTLDVDLAANAAAAQACVTPNPLDFGTVAVGSEIRRSVSISSCGATELTVRGLSLASGSSTAFDLPTQPTLPRVLGPGEAFNVEIRYLPTQPNGDLGVLDVQTDDPMQPNIPVRLLGNAVGLCPPLMRCTPTTLDYGDVQTGVPQTRTVVCRNYGTQPVTITSANATPMPPWTANALLPATLNAGDALTVQVSLLPTTLGAITGSLSVQSNACENLQTIQLVATGIPPVIPDCTPPASFSPQTQWHWTTSPNHPQKDQVWVTPIVMNLNDDNGDGVVSGEDIPDVLFSSFDGRDFRMNPMDPEMGAPIPAVVRALSGDDGRELWTVLADDHRVQSEAQLAAGDIDGDNLPEVIGSKYIYLEGESPLGMGPKLFGRFVRGKLICFDNQGRFKWESDEWTAPKEEGEDGGGPAIADLDQDGFAEIIYRAHVYDHRGRLKWIGQGGSGSTGHGSMPTAVDVTGDGKLEVVVGLTTYRADGSILWQRTDLGFDGTPAIADFEGDGTPEVVIHNGKINILNGEDGTNAYPVINLPFPMSGCSEDNAEECETPIPTAVALADFDGDGRPELAVSNRHLLLVYEANGQENWRVNISDQTGASGPAAFDFEGDGIAEVVYADEQNAFALRGSNGQNIYTAGRSSRTIFEYATIVDVDNDGHANIITVENEPLLRSAKGVKMLSNTAGQWAASTRVWNQHTFHITNVSESGAIPRTEAPHYRGNAQQNSFRAQTSRCQ